MKTQSFYVLSPWLLEKIETATEHQSSFISIGKLDLGQAIFISQTSGESRGGLILTESAAHREKGQILIF